MRAATQVNKATVPKPNNNDSRICQRGGVWVTILTSIVIGEKNGNIETQKANEESGLRLTGMNK